MNKNVINCQTIKKNIINKNIIKFKLFLLTFIALFLLIPSIATAKYESTYQLTKKLSQLSYLTQSDITSDYNYKVRNAVMAFQKYQGITADGIAGPQTKRELKKASRPQTRYKYRHVEVRINKQILLIVNSKGLVTRTINISSGKPGYNTPKGKFNVYYKNANAYSTIYNSPMPYASFFLRGYALHESSDVPNYPASHGCVRIPNGFSQAVYNFASINTPVLIR